MPPNDAPSGAPTATLEDTERGGPVAFALSTGAQVGRYVIVDRLGAGGMGTVYVAYDAQLARRVAIKVLRPDKKGEEAQARLLREAQTMAQLTHPNVVAVYDVGAFGDGVFIAMEYVEGETLRTWLNAPREWRETLAVLQAAGRGLEAAHAAGIVHRDFKPDNVLIGNDGRVLVGDFGIARADRGGSDDAPPRTPRSGPALPPEVTSAASGPTLLDSRLTQTDALVGTVGYMSPERAFEQRDDGRSDQFSFCVTLYRALYGQSPFEFSSLPTYLDALLVPPRPPPGGSRVPSWVRDVVLRGLAYEPSERFASMTELLDALGRDPSKRRRGWILAASGLAIATVAGLGWVQHEASLRAQSRIGERLIAETWGPEVRAKVKDGIAATGLPLAGEFAEKTQAALDTYAADWARAHREASEATLLRGRESAATMQERLTCLDGARDELSALAHLLSRADAVIANHAISAAYGLPVPRACLEPGAGRATSLAADTPERRARMTALRRAVAEAEADRMTGKNEEALAIANRALVEARAIPHRESEAELLFLVGACRRELEDDAVARVTFEEAFAAAEAAGNDSLAEIAAAVVSLELGDTLADKHEAERWLAIAKGIREHEREHGAADDRADAEILEAELSLESAEGHPERTLALRDQLIATLERVYGASHPRIGSAIANRAADLASTGQPERAVAEYRRAIAMQEQIFGRDYPSLSIYYNNLGSTLSELGRYGEAKEALDRSLALVAPLGASSSHNVLPLVTMATLENRVGDRDAALGSAGRALAIAEASGDVRFVPCLRVQQGRALLAKGDAPAAFDACRRALDEEEKQEVIGPDKTYPDGEDALACLGDAELALGRVSDAVAHLERSVSLTKRETPAELSLARFDLARALTTAKEDPTRARSLAETARSELHAAPGMEQAASEVDAWLAKASTP